MNRSVKEIGKNAFYRQQVLVQSWNIFNGGPKLDRFLAKNEHTQSNLLLSCEWTIVKSKLCHKMAWGTFRDISAFYEAIFLKIHFFSWFSESIKTAKPDFSKNNFVRNYPLVPQMDPYPKKT
jgi:hypothetical protein